MFGLVDFWFAVLWVWVFRFGCLWFGVGVSTWVLLWFGLLSDLIVVWLADLSFLV